MRGPSVQMLFGLENVLNYQLPVPAIMEWARLKFLGEQGKWPDFWRALTLSATLRALAVIKLFEEVSGGGGGGGSSSSESY